MSLPPQERERQARLAEAQVPHRRPAPEPSPQQVEAARFEHQVTLEARAFREDAAYPALKAKLAAVCAPSLLPHPDVQLVGASASEQALYRMGVARGPELIDEWADRPLEEEKVE